MKKRWKVFGIICVVLAVLGSAFCISGLLLGATAAGVREVLAGWSDDFYGYGSATVVEQAEESTEYYDSEDAEYAEDSDIYHTQYFENVVDLEVEVSRLSVWIEQSSESRVTVDYELDEDIEDDFYVFQENEELKVELKNRDRWNETHFTEEPKGYVTIGIPQGMKLGEISLKIGAGELNTDVLLAEELDIEVGAGIVYIEEFTAEKLKVECGAGQADLTGDAQKEAKIECGIGTVTYYASGSQYDYDYDLECGMGSLNVGSNSYDGLGREHKIDNGCGRKMEIECGIGVVDVMFDE